MMPQEDIRELEAEVPSPPPRKQVKKRKYMGPPAE